MKITKKQLKQIIKEELSKTLKEGDNIDYFAVVAPDGKVFRVKKNSERVVNDPQKAANLAAAHTAPAHQIGEFKVYEYAQYGGGVRKNPIFVGKAEIFEGLTGKESKEAWEKMKQAANPERGKELVSQRDLKKMMKKNQPKKKKKRMEEDWTDERGNVHKGPAPPGHWRRQREKESRAAIKKGKDDPNRPDPRRG